MRCSNHNPSPTNSQFENSILITLQKTIKETFALNEVPRESFYLGLAGTLPYLATSLSTVFLSYNINNAPVTGSTWMFTPENAHQYLAYIEPIQIGYGAVVSRPLHDLLTSLISNPSLFVLQHWSKLTLLNNVADPLLPRRHPLGTRIRRLRWPPLLPPLCNWCSCTSSRLADDVNAN